MYNVGDTYNMSQHGREHVSGRARLSSSDRADEARVDLENAGQRRRADRSSSL
jgi:hypothetical protein